MKHYVKSIRGWERPLALDVFIIYNSLLGSFENFRIGNYSGTGDPREASRVIILAGDRNAGQNEIH